MDVREKLGLQKQVRQDLEKLKREGLSVRDKLALQKQIRANLEKLGKSVKASQPDKATPNFDQLVKGDFEVNDFVDLVKRVWNELREIGLDESQTAEKVKPPMKTYMEKKLRAAEISEAISGVREMIEDGVSDEKAASRFIEILEGCSTDDDSEHEKQTVEESGDAVAALRDKKDKEKKAVQEGATEDEETEEDEAPETEPGQLSFL